MDEGVEAEVNVGVEVQEEDPETVVKTLEVKEAMAKGIRVKVRVRTLTPNTRLSVILINLHSRPVFVTGHLEKVLTFVWNLGPVHGKTSSCPSPINETVTSSTLDKTTNSLIICYTKTNCQKYTLW